MGFMKNKLFWAIGWNAIFGVGCSTPLPPNTEPLKIDPAVQTEYQNYQGFDGTWENTDPVARTTLILREQRYSFHEVQKFKPWKDISPISGMLKVDFLKKRTDQSCPLLEEYINSLEGQRMKDAVYLFNVGYHSDPYVPDSGGVAVPAVVNYIFFKWPQANPDELTLRLETLYLSPGDYDKREMKFKRVVPEVPRK
jgi:hypothetical protein